MQGPGRVGGGMGAVPDLGSLRGGGQVEEQIPLTGDAPGHYVNDVQPTVGADGTVTLSGRMLTSDGLSKATRMTMPLAMFVELASTGPRIIEAALTRQLRSAQSVKDYMDRGVTGGPPAGEEPRGGPAVDLDSMRPGSDADAGGRVGNDGAAG